MLLLNGKKLVPLLVGLSVALSCIKRDKSEGLLQKADITTTSSSALLTLPDGTSLPIQTYRATAEVLASADANFERRHSFSDLSTEVTQVRERQSAVHLESAEWFALVDYTLSGSSRYQRAFVDVSVFHEAKSELLALISALNAVPKFAGTTWHGKTMNDSYATTFAEGTKYCLKTLLSTSRDADIAREFAAPEIPVPDAEIGVLLYVKGQFGRDIAALSAHPNELEVLFLPGTCFNVDKLTVDADSTGKVWFAHVHLKEM